jgi:hypothetical protein
MGMSIIEVDADEAIIQVEEKRLKSPKLTAPVFILKRI